MVHGVTTIKTPRWISLVVPASLHAKPLPGSLPLGPPLRVDIHLFGFSSREVVHGDEGANVLLADDLLAEHGGGAEGEDVALELLCALVGLDVVALEGGHVLGVDGDGDVAAGAEGVEDAGLDGGAAEGDGLLLAQAGLPLGLEDGHGGQRA